MANPKVIAFWINAFIPRDIFDLTQPVTAGPHAGGTMIPGPLVDCYLTDQRSFSSKRHALSRLHSEGALHVDGNDLRLSQAHRCDATHEIDCKTGVVDCEKKGDTDNMKLSLVAETIVDGKAKIKVKLAANNPCFFGSPDINVEGKINIDFEAKKITFKGKVEPFPAFEAYVVVDGGSAIPLLQLLPLKDSSPGDLFGPPSRSFTESITF